MKGTMTNESDCRKTFQFPSFGKEDSVKETHQGCLSHSINHNFELFQSSKLCRLSKNVPSYKSATHQSLPCVKGGGKNRRFLTEGLTVGSDLRYISQTICAGQSLSQPSADSSLYTREPWALPRQCEKRDFLTR